MSSTMYYNDMPGELRERLRFWEVMNRILKNNSFIDADNIIATISDLKTKVNTLLSSVLRIEHDIDGLHNFDSGPLLNQITELYGHVDDFVNDINNDINAFNNKLAGYSATSSQLTLSNNHAIDARVDVGGENLGARVMISPQDVYIEAIGQRPGGTEVPKGRVIVGGGTTTLAISIKNANNIELVNQSISHYVKITTEGNNVSDMNGLKLRTDNHASLVVTNMGGTRRWVHIPWE
jgi:hypothetical protein